MKTENSHITSYLEVLASISNKLHVNRNEKYILKQSTSNIKLKILHYAKNLDEKYNEDLINLIQYNDHVISDLKILYGIQYKDKLDQQQMKRKIRNSFKSVSSEENIKKLVAYKNTEEINKIYQLYQFKY